MNVLSLFSGIGGLDLGLQRAGMTIAGQVEIDTWCRSILEKHWPEVPRHDDVRTAAEWWLGLVADTEAERRGTRRQGRPAGSGPDREGDAPPGLAGRGAGRPAVDLVCGGFPCQPVSVAGRQLAQADDRWLWPAFAGVVRDLRPAYVLVENVPGLLAHGMGDVLGDLAGLGYDAEWDCVPAAFVGAPHIRRRVFVVAYPSGSGGRALRPVSSAEAGTDTRTGGTGPHVADTAGPRSQDRGTSPSRRPSTTRRMEPQRLGSDVADASGRRHRPPRIFLRPGRHSPLNDRRWPAEPDVGRVAHGIPRRVDRLRGLGNAVVPQVAEHIGRLILQAAA